jgi:hypothetical protein
MNGTYCGMWSQTIKKVAESQIVHKWNMPRARRARVRRVVVLGRLYGHIPIIWKDKGRYNRRIQTLPNILIDSK